jgi:hypothetical protein
LDHYGYHICFTIQGQKLQPKNTIANTQLGLPKSLCAFFSEANSVADLLAAAGQPIEDEDLISYILGGLNLAYTTFITLFNFTTRTTSMTFEEF